MIALESATPGRIPQYAPGDAARLQHPSASVIRDVPSPRPRFWTLPWWLVRWMYRGYTTLNASDMAAAVAFNTLIALVPIMLLAVASAGLFLQNQTVMEQARLAIERLVPGQTTDEAFTAALSARQNSGWLGLISLVGFAWVGTGFVSCLARSMNKIYGARSSGYINEKQRGFVVLMLFSFLFIISSVTAILPTFFINRNLPVVFEEWILASGRYQLIGYGIGLVTSLLLFLTLYRVIPNANQRLADVWPGTVMSALLFLFITQIFPLYIRLTGGGNRYGQILGFVSLLVASLLMLAHIILFGAYLNASWQRQRRLRRRRRIEKAGFDPEVDDETDLFD